MRPPAAAVVLLLKQMNGMLYVADADAVFKKAVAAGAKGVRPPWARHQLITVGEIP